MRQDSRYNQPFAYPPMRGMSGLGEYAQSERDAFALRNMQIEEFNRLQTEVGRAKAHMAQENILLGDSYKEGYAEGHRLGTDDARGGFANRAYAYIKTKWSISGSVKGFRSNLGAYTPEEERKIAEFNTFLARYEAWVRDLPVRLQAEYDMGLVNGYNTAYQSVIESQPKNNVIDNGLRFSPSSTQPTLYIDQNVQYTAPSLTPTIQLVQQPKPLAPITLAPSIVPYEGGSPAPLAPPIEPPPSGASSNAADLMRHLEDMNMNRSLDVVKHTQPTKTPQELAIERAAAAAAAAKMSPNTTPQPIPAQPPATTKKWIWWVVAGLGAAGLAGGTYFYMKKGKSA